MPRDAGGIYFLPAGNPVIPGTVIESDWANPTMSDLGGEVSDSLSRSGKGGMLAALRGLDGSAAQPTFSFTNEPSTGRFRAGPGQVVEAVAGVPVVRYLSTGLEQWDSDIMDWVPLTPRDALGTPFNPGPSNLVSTNVQDAIEEVNDKTGGQITADAVLYDDSAVYFPAITVQLAIDRLGQDVAGLANDILDNADAIDIIGGDLLLLENRVGLNETNIGNNTTNIGLHDTRITENESDISTNQGDISTIKLEQTTQDSRITQNESDIIFTYNITQTNADNISTNVNSINQNASDIGINATNIAINASDLQAFNSIFPSGILLVANGGTGVATSTGTGSTVRNNAPFLDGATGNTPNTANNSTRLATTAYVKNQNYGTLFLTTGWNANGRYSGVRNAATGGQWQLRQWGRANLVQDPGTTTSFPTAYASQADYDMVYGAYVAGTEGLNTVAGIRTRNSNNWTGIHVTSILNGWMAMGVLNYSAVFDAIPVSGDRYYHKVLKTEWIEQLHGPAGPEPDVVVLPPGNTFWDYPLGGDEVLTYDINDLPLARVARVKPAEELIRELLNAAGLTGVEFRRALLADSRGIPADLVAFNAALDIVIAANPYTEAQFLEVL